jgi:NADPH2:quinone reductase
VIIDQVSASIANGNLKAAAILGRIVNVGRFSGSRGELDLDLYALKRVSYIGVTFRTRSIDEVREINRRTRADLGEKVASGDLRIPIDCTYLLDNAAQAVMRMRSNQHFGKIALLT